MCVYLSHCSNSRYLFWCLSRIWPNSTTIIKLINLMKSCVADLLIFALLSLFDCSFPKAEILIFLFTCVYIALSMCQRHYLFRGYRNSDSMAKIFIVDQSIIRVGYSHTNDCRLSYSSQLASSLWNSEFVTTKATGIPQPAKSCFNSNV